jgi:hypothetical protein
MNREEIEKQAKTIMDSFLKELATIEETHTFGLEREQSMREPKHEPSSETFKRAFFANAPKVKDNLIQMERKQW